MGDENQNLNPEEPETTAPETEPVAEPEAEPATGENAEPETGAEPEGEGGAEPEAEPKDPEASDDETGEAAAENGKGAEPEAEPSPVGTEPEAEPESEPEGADPENDNGEPAAEPTAEPAGEANVEFSVNAGGQIYNFKVSLQDELLALTQLVNDTYAESDNAYYMVDAYADTKEVIMVDYWTGKAYKQSYKVRNGVYSLKGDRVSVHARYITDDEEKALDELKSSYAEVFAKLQKYEEEPKKMDILNSSDYDYIADTAEFKKFKEQASHFDLSIEETKAKADELLLAAAKNAKFAAEAPKAKYQVGVKHFPPKKVGKGTGRYGSMFGK